MMYSCRPLHMDEERQDDQLEPTYSSSVPIRDVALRTCRKQWTTGRSGERGSRISVPAARHDDDDDACEYDVDRFTLCDAKGLLLSQNGVLFSHV